MNLVHNNKGVIGIDMSTFYYDGWLDRTLEAKGWIHPYVVYREGKPYKAVDPSHFEGWFYLVKPDSPLNFQVVLAQCGNPGDFYPSPIAFDITRNHFTYTRHFRFTSKGQRLGENTIISESEAQRALEWLEGEVGEPPTSQEP